MPRVGINYKWVQEEKNFANSGATGEVFRVCREDKPEVQGILKQPSARKESNIGSFSDQVFQINSEKNILKEFHKNNEFICTYKDFKITVPDVLDSSELISVNALDNFIVTKIAPGVDLEHLLEQYKQQGQSIPRIIILRVLTALCKILDEAHKRNIVWNDVQAHHFFWYEEEKLVTVIDWANGGFVTSPEGFFINNRNRKFGFLDDFAQAFKNIGDFLTKAELTDLKLKLNWPDKNEPMSLEQLFLDFQSRIEAELENCLKDLERKNNDLKAQLKNLFEKQTPSFDDWKDFLATNKKILNNGGRLPVEDIQEYCKKILQVLAIQSPMPVLGMVEICDWVIQNCINDATRKWKIIKLIISSNSLRNGEDLQNIFNTTPNNDIELNWIINELFFASRIPKWWYEYLQLMGFTQIIEHNDLRSNIEKIYNTTNDHVIDWKKELRNAQKGYENGVAFYSEIIPTYENEIKQNTQFLEKVGEELISWENFEPVKGEGFIPWKAVVLFDEYKQNLPEDAKIETNIITKAGKLNNEIKSAYQEVDFELLRLKLKEALFLDPKSHKIIELNKKLELAQNIFNNLISGPANLEDVTSVVEWAKTNHLILKGLQNELGKEGWLSDWETKLVSLENLDVDSFTKIEKNQKPIINLEWMQLFHKSIAENKGNTQNIPSWLKKVLLKIESLYIVEDYGNRKPPEIINKPSDPLKAPNSNERHSLEKPKEEEDISNILKSFYSGLKNWKIIDCEHALNKMDPKIKGELGRLFNAFKAYREDPGREITIPSINTFSLNEEWIEEAINVLEELKKWVKKIKDLAIIEPPKSKKIFSMGNV